MAKKNNDIIKVDINQATSNELRTYTVTITAPTSEFALTDVLSARGAVVTFSDKLWSEIKRIADNYLTGAEEIIADISKAKPELVAVSAEKTKRGRKPNDKNVNKNDSHLTVITERHEQVA